MTRPCHQTRRTRPLPALRSGLVAALLLALPAAAAEVVAVRVGEHPKFTRVVFELDAAAGYRVEEVSGGGQPVLRVSLDAASRSHRLGAHGDVRDVKVAAGPRAVATIALRKGGLRLQEMILSNPPRIVLDLYEPQTALAQAGAAKPPARAKPRPEAAPKPKPAPARPAAAPPEPKPITEAKAAPAPEKPAPEAKPAPAPGKPAPEAKAAPAPEKVKPAPEVEEPAPTKKELAEAPPAPAPTPSAEPRPAPRPSAPAEPERASAAPPEALPPAHPPISPASPTRPAPARPDATAATPPSAITPPAARVVRPKPPGTAETAKPTPVAPAPADAASWQDRLRSPLGLGAIAVALLAFVALVIAVIRRHRALPNDLDVTAIAEEIAGSAREAEPAFGGADEGFAMGGAAEEPSARAGSDAEASFAGLFDDDEELPAPSARAEEPLPLRRPPPPAPSAPRASSAPSAPSATRAPSAPSATRAPSAPSATRTPSAPRAERAPVAPPVAPETDSESLFDDADGFVGEEATEGEAPMDRDMDLPADSDLGGPPPVMGGAAAMPDVARMLQEFERRIQTLEARLDEANEAREKLERQVAAQSEELRVQRAAIARTQRALRTMSRADEDKATEPALRDGDTQAKTRVNV